MEYTIILEGSAERGFSAYSPDIAVYATGKTEASVRKRMASGIAFQIDMLRKTGDPIPSPIAKTYVLRIDAV
jgi:predicted RNase H-like HicB family nuclease